MADTNLLAALLSGANPLAPQMVGGYQGAQLSEAALNPNFAHNEGPFGALAKTIAGFSGGNQLRQAVEATTAARQAATPDLARLLASNDPFAAIAANPSANPIAQAQILQGATPESAADARLKAAQAGLVGAQMKEYNNIGTPRQPLYASPTSTQKQIAGSGVPLTLGTGFADPIEGILAMPAGSPQQIAAVGRLTRAQKVALAAKLKAQGGANAAGP